MEQAVFRLIHQHQHFGELIREANDEIALPEQGTEVTPLAPCLASAATQDNSLQLSIDACMSCIQVQSYILGIPVPTVAAIECAKELCQLLQATPTVGSEQRKSLKCLLKVIERLTSQQLLNRTHFTEQLSSKGAAVPLELLWQLHACSAIPLDQYIKCNLGRPAVLKKLAQDMSVLCSGMAASDNSSKIMEGVLEVLLRCGYSKSEELVEMDQELAVACQDVLDSIVLELLKLQNGKGKMSADHHLARLFETVRCLPSVDRETVCRFSTKQLQTLLSCSADCEASTAVAKQHDHWTYAKAPQSVTQMFVHLLLTMGEKQVCSVLQKVLEGEQVHWQHTLILVSVFCVCFKQGSSLIKGLVSNLLQASLEDCHSQLLHAAFLLARQAAAEGSRDFSSYSLWFQDQFSSAAGPHAISSKTIVFFVEFLNSLVPHEPVHCLKAHVQHLPHAPSKCQDVLRDYRDLAKTRLADFKGSWQASSGVGPGTSHKAQLATEDVEESVTMFEKTGRIPEKVLQSSCSQSRQITLVGSHNSHEVTTGMEHACVFRRPYYMGQFLPALLAPRMLPDIPDSKMKFIEALKRDGKIPSSMYQKYTEGCANELKMLLEGVSSEDLDEVAMDPMDRLQESLDSLPHLLMKEPTEASYSADIAGHISLMSGRVTAILEHLGLSPSNTRSAEGTDVILLDVSGMSSIEPTIMQVTDKLLGCFCKAHMLLVKSQLSCTSLTESFTLMFATQGSLHYPLYHRLFTLICHQGDTLSEAHIAGLASLLVHMSALGKRLPLARLQTPGAHRRRQRHQQVAEPDQMPLLNLICESMEHRTGEAMKVMLRFCTAVLTCALEHPESRQGRLVPLELKQKFCYLLPRLDPAFRPEFSQAVVPVSGQSSSQKPGMVPGTNSVNVPVVSSQDEVFNRLGLEGLVSCQDQISFEEWLGLELRIHACQDCLMQSQRKTYRHWVLYSIYLPQLVRSTDPADPAAAYKRASTVILNALLDAYTEPSGRSIDERCLHGGRQGQARKNAERSCGCTCSCQEVTQLLQELLSVWSSPTQEPTATADTDCPWLLAVFTARLKKISQPRSETDDQTYRLGTALEVANQMKLAQCLPPHLLLVDCLWHIPLLADIKHLTDYINLYLREHLQEEFCSFSHEVVTVILQGFLQVYTLMAQVESGRALDVVVGMESLLQECPIFTLSILRHWNALLPVMSQLNNATTHHQPYLLDTLSQLHALVQEVGSGGSGSGVLSSPQTLRQLASEPWMLVVTVVSLVVLLEERSVSAEELVSLQEKLVRRFGEIFQKDEVGQCLFECLVAMSAWLLLTGPAESQRRDVHQEAAAILLSKQPKYLTACSGDTVLKRAVLQRSVASLYPVVCFRVLQNRCCCSVPQQATTDPRLLTVLLHLYSSLVHLHCQADQSVAEISRHSATDGQQIIDLEFLQSCQALLQRVLASCPNQTLAALDEAVLADADPEVRSTILQRLQSC